MNILAESPSETYYDILHVKKDASYEEIRQSYRLALLESHPDKLHKSLKMPNPCHDVEHRFMKVQKAWETLSDSRLRALYDNMLRSLRCDDLVADDISLDDMMVEDTEKGFELLYQCRCGDCYMVSGPELEELGYEICRDDKDEISFRIVDGFPGCVILPCGSCSLKIRLLIDTNSRVKL